MDILRKNSVKALVLGTSTAVLLMLSGCGDSDSSSSSTGVFQDSPVDGLKYSAPSASGTTQDGGKFTYYNQVTANQNIGKPGKSKNQRRNRMEECYCFCQ